MSSSLWGTIETYGIRNLIGQAWEKLVLDPWRYRQVHGKDYLPALGGKLVPSAGNSAPQTIFLLCHCYFPDSSGGTERFAQNLASALQETGNRVYILAYSARVHTAYSSQISGILYTEEMVDGISVIRFRHRHAPVGILKDFAARDPEIEAFAAFLVQKYHPNWVHFLHLSRVNAFAEACRKNGVAYGVTATDFFAVCHFYTRVDRRGCICPGSAHGTRCKKTCPVRRVKCLETRYQNASRLLRSAQWVAVPSNYVANIFQQEFPKLRVAVIPHGIETANRNSSRSGPVRQFAFVGKLAELKGISSLIRVFRQMPEDCFLDVYGEGPFFYKRRLRRLAGGNSRIVFHGAVPASQVCMAYQRADCVVIPSVVPESYNFVIREALQSGCLVVAAKVGAMPEAVSENENGFLFSCGNPDEMRQAMMKAYRFRWKTYRQEIFPGKQQEADTYRLLYQQAGFREECGS